MVPGNFRWLGLGFAVDDACSAPCTDRYQRSKLQDNGLMPSYSDDQSYNLIYMKKGFPLLLCHDPGQGPISLKRAQAVSPASSQEVPRLVGVPAVPEAGRKCMTYIPSGVTTSLLRSPSRLAINHQSPFSHPSSTTDLLSMRLPSIPTVIRTLFALSLIHI